MPLTLMYITNDPRLAVIAQDAGVDRIWVDMEYIGKSERQRGIYNSKSCHTVGDVERLRPVVSESELMVRVNPIHKANGDFPGSRSEIDAAIAAGADVIMLPMFKSVDEVSRFIGYVGGRAKTMLLFETAEAVENADEILSVPGIDEVHIGLNDLHIAYNRKFMFELLCDGTVQRLCEIFAGRGLKYGFGGIARVGCGLLPAENIIAEHYRIGSTAATLSRLFFDAKQTADPETIRRVFEDGINGVREREREVSRFTREQYEENFREICERVKEIVKSL